MGEKNFLNAKTSPFFIFYILLQGRDRAHLLNGGTNGLVGNPGTANALATKMYEERLKLPLQRDSLEDAAMKVGRYSGCLIIKMNCIFLLCYIYS